MFCPGIGTGNRHKIAPGDGGAAATAFVGRAAELRLATDDEDAGGALSASAEGGTAAAVAGSASGLTAGKELTLAGAGGGSRVGTEGGGGFVVAAGVSASRSDGMTSVVISLNKPIRWAPHS